MKKNSFIPLPPFKGWVLQNFPFIEEDFDAITSYQLWCKVVAYLNNTNNNVNVLAKEVLDIKNYFDNLDVQEEIDNKLDEMAESGQLTDIIAQYLQLAGILAFNTLDDLENAENVVDGSFTKTYGKITYNDGYGAFYKIRTLINTDVIDGDNLVALTNYPTLVAEKIIDATLNTIKDITDFNENNYTLCIGDSYARGSSNGEFIDGWPVKLQQLMNLSNDYFKKIFESGAGFCYEGLQGHTFLTLLQANIDNIPNKDKIKNIIICAGHNDYDYTQTQIETAMVNFINYCHTNIPNATIYCGMIAGNLQVNTIGRTRRYAIYNNILPAYANFSNLGYKCVYLSNLENILKDERYMSGDEIHPNQNGYNKIASAIYNALKGNFSYISGNLQETYDVALNLSSGSSAKNFTMVTNIFNNITLLSHGSFNYTLDEALNLDAYNTFRFLENFPVTKNSIIINTVIAVKTNNVWKVCKAEFVPDNSNNAINIRLYPEDNTALTGITQILIYNNCYTIPTIENFFNKK